MHFNVLDPRTARPSGAKDIAYLIRDRWDDWGKFRTQFFLIVFDREGRRVEPGDVKIGEKGLAPAPGSEIAPGKRAPSIPTEFDALSNDFFSLGQSDTYYEALNLLPEDVRDSILVALRDCAFDAAIFDQMADEEVMRESLLRSVTTATVRNRFSRLAKGDAALTEFFFRYDLPPSGGDAPPPSIEFHAQPYSEPPTNVHVLIGRNGVGKTRCMQSMARALLTEPSDPLENGSIQFPSLSQDDWSFAGVVAVAFSAFDSFTLPPVAKSGTRAAMIGPSRAQIPHDAVETSAEAAEPSFTDGFVKSLAICRGEPRRTRLHSAIQTLEADPLFAEAAVRNLLDSPDESWERDARRLFKRLSSGHAVVLLTVTRLVELVDERTIVLIDEPEGHLHPPLLSALIRALSDLLIKRNGVAIIATHSPVVLQEVPQSCVWVLRRSGTVAKAERPSIQTFGENVGVLTREVFGLEVTHSGFHQLLQHAVANSPDNYEAVLAHFNHQLGGEAQSIVRNLLALSSSEQDQTS